MTPDDLAAWQSLADLASPGPWSHRLDLTPPDPGIEAAGGGCVAHVQCHGNVNTVARCREEFSHDDARFIAASREAVPSLLRRVAELEESLAETAHLADALTGRCARLEADRDRLLAAAKVALPLVEQTAADRPFWYEPVAKLQAAIAGR